MLTSTSRGAVPLALAFVLVLQAAPASTAALVAPGGPSGLDLDLARALAQVARDASRDPSLRALDAAEIALARSSHEPAAGAYGSLVAQQQRNLATARTLLTAADAEDGTLARALHAVEISSAWQRAALGADAVDALAAPTPPAYATLGDAVRALAARQPAPTALDAEAFARLEALPPSVALPLRDAVTAFVAFHDAVASGFTAAGIERDALPDLASLVAPDGSLTAEIAGAPTRAQLALAFGPALAARERFLATLPALHAVLPLAPAHAGAPCAPIVLAPAFALDAEGCDSTYETNVALSIDAGGDDLYLNNAGGYPAASCAAVAAPGAAALVDLGGNDRYEDLPDAAATFPDILCGVNGGGSYGAGLLVDLAGDDLYQRVSQVANGAGSTGLGLLVDAAGSNRYLAVDIANGGGIMGAGALLDLGDAPTVYVGSQVSANGGACFGGYAFLYDAGGSDVYRSLGGCGSNGQAGGPAPAVGFVLDAGDAGDLYEGRNGAGGIGAAGFLYDEGGDDTYVGPLLGISNGGAANGVGMLLDAAGDDLSFGGHLGTNGGSMGGLGHLLDLDGDDLYVAGSLATNGGASDEGHGLLFDARGNDRYEAGGIAANGGGFFGGKGSLLDLAGDDAYVALGNGVNGGGSTVLPGAGTLLDASGRDVYVDEDGGAGEDVTVLLKGTVGSQLDLEVAL